MSDKDTGEHERKQEKEGKGDSKRPSKKGGTKSPEDELDPLEVEITQASADLDRLLAQQPKSMTEATPQLKDAIDDARKKLAFLREKFLKKADRVNILLQQPGTLAMPPGVQQEGAAIHHQQQREQVDFGLRKVSDKIDVVSGKIETVSARIEAISTKIEKAKQEQASEKEKESLLKEKDSLVNVQDSLVKEKDSLVKEKDSLLKDKEVLRKKEEALLPHQQGTVNCFCMEDKKDEVATLKCGHSFHRTCIAKWKAQNRTCPVCRRKITLSGSPQTHNSPAQRRSTGGAGCGSGSASGLSSVGEAEDMPPHPDVL